MKIKIIKQLDETITFSFINSKGKKIPYTITDIEKDGIGYMYTLEGIRVSSYKPLKGLKTKQIIIDDVMPKGDIND